MKSERQIDPDAFQSIDIRAGTVKSARSLAKARQPAWVLDIDFGPDIGVLRSSARITAKYASEDLIDRQVLAVVNLGTRQIGNIMSECLVLGLHDDNDDVVLAAPERPVPDGRRLC
ncbi:MAG: tRNA-binding protein [Phycisphaerales bacterium]|nr:tRNA-binding protein [Phycisphaerales bacterium]